MKVKALTALALVFVFYTTSAQDLVYTVSGQYENSPLALDSILVENLTNGTRLLFGSLPEQDDYKINLSTGEQEGPTGIYEYRMDNLISVAKNLPGNLGISILTNKVKDAGITIYNTLGQVIWENQNLKLSYGNVVDVHLPGDGIYIVRLSTELGSKAFRAAGSFSRGAIIVKIDGKTLSESTILKKSYSGYAGDFSFQTGDNLRISTYRDGYYARPTELTIVSSETIPFTFELSSVDEYGISDVFRNINDSTFVSIEYNTSTGLVNLVPETGEDSVEVGDIITIDLDTAGYLRKVVGITDLNGEIVLETEQATMNELFVDKSFSLNTTMIEPTSALKSTSSMKEISVALTDEEGFIHPFKVLYYDETGAVHELHASGLKSTDDEIRQPIVNTAMDFSMTDLYGEEGDDIHFYFSEGDLYFNTDAVFEFDFSYEGEFTEDTKVKKGDLNVFEFYLEASAGVQTKLELDMSKSWDKEYRPDKPLFHIAKAKAQFVVPPGVPVWIDFDVNMLRALILHADASLHADWGFEVDDTLRLGGRYTKGTGELTPISEFVHYDSIYPLNLEGEVNASARLELYPRVDMKLYSIFGPYAEVVPFVEGTYNAALQSQITQSGTETFIAFNAGLDLGLDLRIGTELKVLGFNRGFGPIEIPCLSYPLWSSPYDVELLTSLPTAPSIEETIPLLFKVTDKFGLPEILAPIYIDGDGTFSKQIIFTNAIGEASVDWIVGSSEGEYEISATIFAADKSVIDNATGSITVVNYGPPEADFTADATTIVVGESVSFTDISTGDPTTWLWDFGDGSTSTEQNPVHTYQIVGDYSVSLTVTNENGSDVELKSNYIIVTSGENETGLVAYYPFNGNSNDESGSGNDGIVNGAIPTADRFGNENSAYIFDGVDDYIDLSSIPNLQKEENFTFSAWISLTQIEQYGVIYGEDDGLGSGWVALSIGYTSNKLTLGIYNNNWSKSYSNEYSFNSDQLYFICITKEGTNVNFYVDGVNIGTENNLTHSISNRNAGFGWIGRVITWTSGPANHFNGLIDDIRIYNSVVSEAEISYLYHEGGY